MDLNRHFSKIFRWPKGHEKVLNIRVVQSRPQWDYVSAIPSECLSSKKKKKQITDACQDVEKREPLCKAGGNVDWYSHYGKHWMFARINKITMLKRSLHPHVLFFAALFTTAEIWKQTVYSLRDEQRKCGIYRNNGICYSRKAKEILPFVTTLMDLEGIMLTHRWEIADR